LGTVPTANKATVASTAESLTAGEPWHDVGAAGEPGFQNSWQTSGSVFTPPVGFYKDHEGIVHLTGFANGGSQKEIFQLPAGFQPLKAKLVEVPVICGGAGCPNSIGTLTINGGGFGVASGAVFAPENTAVVGLEGISFRAES
jgi:hypothetical protein